MVRVATRLRNILIVAILLISPWVFACLHPPAQVFIKFLLTLLGAVFLFLKSERPETQSATGREAVLAILTILILCFGVASVLVWSIDHRVSAYALWGYAGLAALFWSTRDWISENPDAPRRILWLVLLNAGLIGAVALIHRLSGSPKVLWIYEPAVTSKFYVFGPFEYRATAAQFFNLLWPVALGLYLQEQSAKASRPRFPMIVVILLMVCPLVTSSRGGMLLAFLGGLIMTCALYFSGSFPAASARRFVYIGLAVAALFLLFGAKPLKKRWQDTRSLQAFFDLKGRLPQNKNSWRIISDFPILGVGPGAYEAAYHIYGFENVFKPANSTNPRDQVTWDFFYAKAHNDWLQTLAEWGFPATALLICALLLSLPPPSSAQQIGIAVGIFLTFLHATFDYPSQNLAIFCHLIALLAIGSATTRLSATRPSATQSTEPPSGSA